MNNRSCVHLSFFQALPFGIFRNGLPHPSSLKLRWVRNDECQVKVRHYEERERRGNLYLIALADEMNGKYYTCLSFLQALPYGVFRNGLPHPSSLKLRWVRNDECQVKVRHYEERERRGNLCLPWITVCILGNDNLERLLLSSSLKGQ